MVRTTFDFEDPFLPQIFYDDEGFPLLLEPVGIGRTKDGHWYFKFMIDREHARVRDGHYLTQLRVINIIGRSSVIQHFEYMLHDVELNINRIYAGEYGDPARDICLTITGGGDPADESNGNS